MGDAALRALRGVGHLRPSETMDLATVRRGGVAGRRLRRTVVAAWEPHRLTVEGPRYASSARRVFDAGISRRVTRHSPATWSVFLAHDQIPRMKGSTRWPRLPEWFDRTGEAIDDFEAAGKLWEPGAHGAEEIAAYYRGMLGHLFAEFQASAERGVFPRKPPDRNDPLQRLVQRLRAPEVGRCRGRVRSPRRRSAAYR